MTARSHLALRGFTLVETVVVMALVTLLVGLMMPVLGRVRAGGRGTECLSNLRQMAIAAQTYAAVYDAWPVAVRFEQAGGGLRQVAWDWVTTLDGTLVGPGPLWSFSDHPDRVQQCPEYVGETNFADPFTGYNYNTSYLGGEAIFPATGWDAVRRGVPPAACARSSTCAMFGDGGRRGGTNKFMRAPMNREGCPLSTLYSGGQAFRHLEATNVAYADGHVGTAGQPRRGALATEALLEESMGYPENGFLSDGDSAYAAR